MCPRQTAALLGPVGRSTLQKEVVTVCATLQKELYLQRLVEIINRCPS